MRDTVVSLVIGLATGTLIGVWGKYYADKLTDRRHHSEKRSAAKKKFDAVYSEMPALLDAIKADTAEYSLIREFFVLSRRGVTIGGAQRRLIYYEAEHNSLTNKLSILVTVQA